MFYATEMGVPGEPEQVVGVLLWSVAFECSSGIPAWSTLKQFNVPATREDPRRGGGVYINDIGKKKKCLVPAPVRNRSPLLSNQPRAPLHCIAVLEEASSRVGQLR